VFFFRIRKFLFRNLINGFLVSQLHDAGDGINVNTDIVSCEDLQDNVLIIGIFRPGKDRPFKLPARGMNFYLCPNPGIEFLQYFECVSFIALKNIVAHD